MSKKKNFIQKIKSRDYYFSIDSTKIVLQNRKILSKFKEFSNEKVIKKSEDFYGLGQNIQIINKKMGYRMSNLDLLQLLSLSLSEKVIYTEIGVSVLKNFYLMANYLDNAELYAFDRNEIYKNVEKEFTSKKRNGNVGMYKFNNNLITYFKGDVYSKDDWKELAGLQKTKTNLIFSDADHSYEGIVFEYDHFYKENIADEFIIYFDDINSKTFPGLYKVTELMNENRKNKINCYTFLINGWMGKNRNQHRNAILTNVDIEKFLKSKLTKLKDFKKIYPS